MYRSIITLPILIMCIGSAASAMAQCVGDCEHTHTWNLEWVVEPCKCSISPINSTPWIFPTFIAGGGVPLQDVPKRDLTFPVDGAGFGCEPTTVQVESKTYSSKDAPTFTHGKPTPQDFNNERVVTIPNATWTGGENSPPGTHTATLSIRVSCSP